MQRQKIGIHSSRCKRIASARPHCAVRPSAAAAAAAASARPEQAPGKASRGILYDFHDRLIPYEQAWSWQKQRVAELCSPSSRDRQDTVFLLQHPPVYTLGAGSTEAHVKFNMQQPPHPLHRTERAGEVTYHGPGQLVMYPILDLSRHQQDLHWYLRSLEEVVITALATTSGLRGERIEGLTGVWVDGAKLAAIGVRARKWVTYHGLALNVSTVLQPFTQIVPCGISDRPVGSVKTALAAAAAGPSVCPPCHGNKQQQGHDFDSCSSNSSSSSQPSNTTTANHSSTSLSSDAQGGVGVVCPADADDAGQQQQQQQLNAVAADPLIIEYRYALLEAFEEVFGLQLQPASEQQVEHLLELCSLPSSSAAPAVQPNQQQQQQDIVSQVVLG